LFLFYYFRAHSTQISVNNVSKMSFEKINSKNSNKEITGF
jgi:hypothetical protein